MLRRFITVFLVSSILAVQALPTAVPTKDRTQNATKPMTSNGTGPSTCSPYLRKTDGTPMELDVYSFYTTKYKNCMDGVLATMFLKNNKSNKANILETFVLDQSDDVAICNGFTELLSYVDAKGLTESMCKAGVLADLSGDKEKNFCTGIYVSQKGNISKLAPKFVELGLLDLATTASKVSMLGEKCEDVCGTVLKSRLCSGFVRVGVWLVANFQPETPTEPSDTKTNSELLKLLRDPETMKALKTLVEQKNVPSSSAITSPPATSPPATSPPATSPPVATVTQPTASSPMAKTEKIQPTSGTVSSTPKLPTKAEGGDVTAPKVTIDHQVDELKEEIENIEEDLELLLEEEEEAIDEGGSDEELEEIEEEIEEEEEEIEELQEEEIELIDKEIDIELDVVEELEGEKKKMEEDGALPADIKKVEKEIEVENKVVEELEVEEEIVEDQLEEELEEGETLLGEFQDDKELLKTEEKLPSKATKKPELVGQVLIDEPDRTKSRSSSSYGSWHFFTLFLLVAILAILGYLCVHNRKKLREGVTNYMSDSRKRRRGREYKPLLTGKT